jgi:hypothetical protein
MRLSPLKAVTLVGLLGTVFLLGGLVYTQARQDKKDPPIKPDQVDEDFAKIKKNFEGAKEKFGKQQAAHLEERYDLADKAANGSKMSRGKAVQAGPRTKLSGDMNWEKLGGMSPDPLTPTPRPRFGGEGLG